MSNNEPGIRIKATEGKTGTIKGITYSGITLSSIRK
jgi:polygalacturonase